MVYEDSYILDESQVDMMKYGVNTDYNATKIVLLSPEGGALKFIQDSHIVLFGLEASSISQIYRRYLLDDEHLKLSVYISTQEQRR